MINSAIITVDHLRPSLFDFFTFDFTPNMFEIPVKIENMETRKLSVALFHILAALFLIVNIKLLFKYLSYSKLWLLLLIYLVAGISVLYAIFRKKIDREARLNGWLRLIQVLSFFTLGIFILQFMNAVDSISVFIWAGICTGLFFMEKYIFSKPTLKITETGFEIPSGVSMKKVGWNKIESIIVRKDFITLNYFNNRYHQLEIETRLPDTEIEQISLFCKRKIAEAK